MSPTRLLAVAASALGAGAAGLFIFFRDQTTDSDETGEDVARVDVPQGLQSLGARAVEVLSRHVGARGNGPKGSAGYHRGTVIDRINLGVYGDGKRLLGQPWCARAVRWAYEVAAQELGLPHPFAKIKGTLAMASSWKDGPFSSFKLAFPRIGAVLVVKTKAGYHTALIAKVLDGRTITTTEGNHRDTIANVKRKIDPSKDTIVDVEGYIASIQGVAPGPFVAGLDLLGA